MAENSGISWCHNTLNFWLGCDKIAPECSKCYIDRVLLRQSREPWGEIYRTKTWDDAGRWQRRHERTGHAVRVFTCSLSDFFHVKADGWRDEAWEVIRSTPNLVYLILTKRPERIEKHLPAGWPEQFPNVWPGVSVGCLQTLNKMDALRRIPVHEQAVRWISAEPLLEDISRDVNLRGYGWVVCGGESGSGAEYLWDKDADWRKEFNTGGRRTMRVEWAERLMRATHAAGGKFLFKQATAERSGQGSNVLGRIVHEFPDAHGGMPWAPTMAFEERHKWTPVQIAQYRERSAAMAVVGR